MESKQATKFLLGKRNTFILLISAFIAVGSYLIYCFFFFRIGFPLDDAWIHQTFARNLVQFGQWAYTPGQPTSGSTSPLWTVILSVSYLLKIGPYIWTFLVNILILFSLGFMGEKIARTINPNYSPFIPIIGIFLIFEWHFTWAAASGMETVLFTLIGVVTFWVGLSDLRWRWLIGGCLTGLSIWVRPEGITFLGVLIWFLFFLTSERKNILLNLSLLLLGVMVFAFPYILLNVSLSGTIFPNTFLAKQTEYAILLQQSIILRIWNLLVLPFSGVGIILLPGLIYQIIRYIRQKKWAILGIIIWFISFILIYAIRLPVTYQNGRYIIPTMAIPIIVGSVGTFELLERIRLFRFGFIIDKVWRWSLYGILMVFFLSGARTYAFDVAIIETEMVDTSKWVAVNTPPGSLIASHDIGALGFFGERPILDLAGLVTPDVIPFIRNESMLETYIHEKGAAYLMTFPDWYPNLVRGKIPIYSTDGKYSPEAGGTNMQVYKINNP
jgi:hypothetical protein